VEQIIELFRASLLADPDVRAVVTRSFTEAMMKAIGSLNPNELGDLLIAVGNAIKTPAPPV